MKLPWRLQKADCSGLRELTEMIRQGKFTTHLEDSRIESVEIRQKDRKEPAAPIELEIMAKREKNCNKG